jgi:hypothetical protein
MESIPCHSGHINSKSNLPRPKSGDKNKGGFVKLNLVFRTPKY